MLRVLAPFEGFRIDAEFRALEVELVVVAMDAAAARPMTSDLF